MSIRDKQDLEGMKRAGRVVAETILAMKRAAAPGVTTKELDLVAADVFAKHGARSAPMLTYKFPGYTCISLNDEAVHGVPDETIVQPGDVLKLDVTAELAGYIADAAITVVIDPATPEKLVLVDTARKAFYAAIDKVRAGALLRDWGQAVEREVNRNGCQVLEELFGHGVGRTIHEAPRNVPNYDERRMSERFSENMTVACEPIISQTCTRTIKDKDDGWTLKTRDGSLAAHYEHTVLVTKGKPVILTAP
jgi:methionyl aminopeptidase